MYLRYIFEQEANKTSGYKEQRLGDISSRLLKMQIS